MIQDGVPAYACCSIGIGRWYWAVWASEEEARERAKPVASGYEKTAKAAEQKAAEAAGAGGKRLASKWASGFKRGGSPSPRGDAPEVRVKPRSRLSRPVGAAGRPPSRPAPPAFLYAASESDEPGTRGEVVVVRHRIVRQTAGKLHIDRAPFRDEDQQARDESDPASEPSKPKTLAVDRATLRREGRFAHRGTNFYASEEAGIRDVHAGLTARNAWCATLGVRFPCSAESIKAAYRRLARQTHPDAGGDPVQFRALERAYREALAFFAPPDGA